MNKDIMDLIESYLMEELEKEEKLGIPDSDYVYHKINDNQDRDREYLITQEFIRWILGCNPNIFSKNINTRFINYGDTELVYVLDDNSKKQTLLVGQPNIKFGYIKKEYDNLMRLSKKHPDIVISPIEYFHDGKREAYLTPYIYQARCIASIERGYGAYIPEPRYCFMPYNDKDEYTITKCIIAILILLYDEENKLGVSSCKIGGGDFILEKSYDIEIHSIENTLKKLHLIAARDMINIELKDYIELIKNEFIKSTYYRNIKEKDPNILVNLKNRCPMKIEAIEDGIQLGLKLRK